MASNFSVWLRETARLYLRYMAVGLLGVPLALLYAGAERAHWNMTVVAVVLAGVGFVSAFFLWRRIGDWQAPAVSAVSANFEDAWIELVNVAFQNAVPREQIALSLQQVAVPVESMRDVDVEKLQAWSRVFAADFEVFHHLLLQETEQRRQSEQRGQSLIQPPVERTRQRQPAWALALS
jgi:hypothetical protein